MATFKDTMNKLGIKDEKTLRDFLSSADYSVRGTRRAVKGFNKLKDDNQYEFTEGGFRVRTPEGMASTSGRGRGNLKGKDIGDLIGLGRDISTLAGALDVGRTRLQKKEADEKAAVEAQAAANAQAGQQTAASNLMGMRGAMSDAPRSTQPETQPPAATPPRNRGGGGNDKGGNEKGKDTAPGTPPPPTVAAPATPGIDSSMFMPNITPGKFTDADVQRSLALFRQELGQRKFIGGGPEIDPGRLLRDMGVDTSKLGAFEFIVGPQQAIPVQIPSVRPLIQRAGQIGRKVLDKVDDAGNWLWGEKGFDSNAWRKAQDAITGAGKRVSKTKTTGTTSKSAKAPTVEAPTAQAAQPSASIKPEAFTGTPTGNTFNEIGKTSLAPEKFNAEIQALLSRNPKARAGILSDGTRVRVVQNKWQIYRYGGKIMANGGKTDPQKREPSNSRIDVMGGWTPYIRNTQLKTGELPVTDPRTGEQVAYWDFVNSVRADPKNKVIQQILLNEGYERNFAGLERWLNNMGEKLRKAPPKKPESMSTQTSDPAREQWKWQRWGGKLPKAQFGDLLGRKTVGSTMGIPKLPGTPTGVALSKPNQPVFMTENDLYGQYDATGDQIPEMNQFGDPGDSNLNLNDLLYLGSGIGSSAYALARANKFSRRRAGAVPSYMKPQFEVGAVRDIVKPRYAKYYTPTGSDLNSEMRSKSFADAMQSEADYNYEMNRDASRMQQEEMIRDRRNKVVETEANLVNRERDMRANLNMQDYLYGRGLMDEGVLGLSDNVANFASQSAYRDAGERAAVAKYLAEKGDIADIWKLYPRLARRMNKGQ